ncbi:MAG: hypothetical protein L0G38_11350 [Lactococcus sp.]|nr:hypothetical protein [Lactococcus sp.]
MADFTNRQLAEIISQTSKEIGSNVLKERKIANDLAITNENLSKNIEGLKSEVSDLKTTSIKPDLSDLNKFYEEKTAENIKRLNSRLNVPNLAIYVWLSSLALFLLSAFMIWFFIKSKQDILTEYRQELSKEGKTIVLKKDELLFKEMLNWFDKNPNTRDKFIQSREEKK